MRTIPTPYLPRVDLIQLDLPPDAMTTGVSYGAWGQPDASIEFLDLFCGGGGSGCGILRAFEEFDTPVRGTFVNHAWEAIRVHVANHPKRHRHFCTGVDDVSPEALYAGRKPFFLWASPICTQHSFAHAGAPLNEQARSTANCIIRWLRKSRPVHAIIENVPEFLRWGDVMQKRDPRSGRAIWSADLAGVRRCRPAAFHGSTAEKVEVDWVPFTRNFAESRPEYRARLAASGFEPFLIPDPRRRGNRYRAWLRKVQREGYAVEARVLPSCNYGDPTSRQRLFINCVRVDTGRKIVWPQPTHASPDDQGRVPAGLDPHRTAANSVLDWSKTTASIFARSQSYADNTLRRMGVGLSRYSLRPLLEARGIRASLRALREIEPFILPQQQGGRSVKSIHEPLSTVTTTMTGERLVRVLATRIDRNSSCPRLRRALRASLATQGVTLTSSVKISPLTSRNAGALAPLISGLARRPDLRFWKCSVRVGRGVRHYPILECHGVTYLLDIQARVIEWQELSLAQGFPPDYQWIGNSREIIKGIGNSVTCGVSYALTKAALTQNPDVRASAPPGLLGLVS